MSTEEQRKKWREQGKKRLEQIKADPGRYKHYLEMMRIYSKRSKSRRTPEQLERARQVYRKWARENKEKRYESTKKFRNKVRQEILEHYGKVCACCGESNREFLTLDHIHGGGNKERKKLGQLGVNFYCHLRRLGYPSGYRTLCLNCNFSLGHYGYCPHQKVK